MKPERFQGVVPKENWPECLQGHAEVAGIFIGGCVARGVGSSFRAQAHAHLEGPNTGWICIRGWRRLYQRSLMLHELAHVKSGHGHTDKWRAMLRALGGKVPGHLQKKRRVLRSCACGLHRFANAGARWYAADEFWHSWGGCRFAPMRVAAGGEP